MVSVSEEIKRLDCGCDLWSSSLVRLVVFFTMLILLILIFTDMYFMVGKTQKRICNIWQISYIKIVSDYYRYADDSMTHFYVCFYIYNMLL